MGKRVEHQTIEGVQHKWCSHCQKWKVLLAFTKCKRTYDHLQTKCQECTTAYVMARYNAEPKFRMMIRLQARIDSAMKRKGLKREMTILQMIGCTQDQFIEHMESQFVDGMSWANSDKWQIDHDLPCSSFDLKLATERATCFSYLNMQPLWAKDNRKKRSKITRETFEEHRHRLPQSYIDRVEPTLVN